MHRGISLGILRGTCVLAEIHRQRPNPRPRTVREQMADLSQHGQTNRRRGMIVPQPRNRITGRSRINLSRISRSPTGHSRLRRFQTTARRKRDPMHRRRAMIVRRRHRKIGLNQIRRRQVSRLLIDRSRIVQSRRRTMIVRRHLRRKIGLNQIRRRQVSRLLIDRSRIVQNHRRATITRLLRNRTTALPSRLETIGRRRLLRRTNALRHDRQRKRGPLRSHIHNHKPKQSPEDKKHQDQQKNH
jgi:hypothetical protein